MANKLDELVYPSVLNEISHDTSQSHEYIGLVNYDDFQISFTSRGISLEPIAYGLFVDEPK